MFMIHGLEQCGDRIAPNGSKRFVRPAKVVANVSVFESLDEDRDSRRCERSQRFQGSPGPFMALICLDESNPIPSLLLNQANQHYFEGGIRCLKFMNQKGNCPTAHLPNCVRRCLFSGSS